MYIAQACMSAGTCSVTDSHTFISFVVFSSILVSVFVVDGEGIHCIFQYF